MQHGVVVVNAGALLNFTSSVHSREKNFFILSHASTHPGRDQIE